MWSLSHSNDFGRNLPLFNMAMVILILIEEEGNYLYSCSDSIFKMGAQLLFSGYYISEDKNHCPVEFQFVIFNPLSYCFKETIGFDVKCHV